MEVISLSSLIQVAEESELNDYLSSFLCCKNKDVESFLHNKAVSNEKRSFTRTSLVIDEKSNNDIVGYFTLMVKPFDILTDVSKTARQRLAGNKEAEVFNSILIAQLGRSDAYKGVVKGEEILNFALENCKLINGLTGLRIVCVEYEDISYLNDFYIGNGFTYLQTNDNDHFLSYLRIEY